MQESKIEQAACRKILQRYGIKSIKLTPSQSTGYPDRLFFMPGGRPLFIEFKRPGEQLRPKQRYIMRQLQKLGYNVHVCDSDQDAIKVVRNCIAKLSLEPRR